MGKFHDDIPQSYFEWIKKQHMFWVATAPLNAQGHVNVSPKGTADCFHVVNSKQVWYEDLTGSGVETISHIRENGRITVMFCSFEGPPRILRLYGIGTVHEYGSLEYNKFIPATTRKPGSRAVIVIDVYKVTTSCGYAVPLYDFVMHRTQLLRFGDMVERMDRVRAASRDQKTPDQVHDTDDVKTSNYPYSLRDLWQLDNAHSLDGLPGLLTAPDAILATTPQNNFDKNSARPMLRRSPALKDPNTGKERRWFTYGFVFGTATVFMLTRLARGLTAG